MEVKQGTGKYFGLYTAQKDSHGWLKAYTGALNKDIGVKVTSGTMSTSEYTIGLSDNPDSSGVIADLSSVELSTLQLGCYAIKY